MPDQREPVAGDLVQTPAGEYAIVVNAAMRELFLSSGLRDDGKSSGRAGELRRVAENLTTTKWLAS